MSDDTESTSASPSELPPDRPPQSDAGESPPSPPAATPGVHLPADAMLRGDVIRSDDLFQGATEIHIVHCDVTYRLVITRSGKLVLRK